MGQFADHAVTNGYGGGVIGRRQPVKAADDLYIQLTNMA